MMPPDLRTKIAAFGYELTPELLGGTSMMFSQLFKGMDSATMEEADYAYGPHERNRLDIYRREGVSGAPVFVFVHGGGFIMGDKRNEASPFYRNVGDFAARQGWIGVTITYRLAPEHMWPSGPEDLGLLVGWLRENIARYGGDPEKIVLSGQSAGAVHVASYVAHPAHHAVPGGGIAGAVLMSGIYDTVGTEPNDMHRAYYGTDPARYPAANCVPGLLDTEIPLCLTVSEFDPEAFRLEAARLVGAWGEAKAGYPEMHYLAGHNHLSPAQSLGSPVTDTEALLADFVGRVTA
ncbi:alpha/beta hydrolase fold domain-containing protein [Altererythrobacter salegens]|uniref:Alpha/beta hydrolase fold domain-containing protein n=1 Tax=Croceibacterium salegens TaxID=1737568 RepID=A0A6I4SUA0_9SPHN|nr:alpha/beta hydrolase [Croceibacterium salegens]MXO58998.1 alpha/beta hydrolase fold domain-containing protein [Croceibacterium salegens]